MRLTEYHCGKAVLKNKNLDSDAAKKLAAYEDLGYSPKEVENMIKALKMTIDYIDRAAFSFLRDEVMRRLLDVRKTAEEALKKEGD